LNANVSLATEGASGELTGVAQTARWTAASRARESRRPDQLFNDPLAAVLAGEEGAALLTHFHTAHAADTGNPFLPIRTRWFDDYIAETVNPACQVISLGAGLDTRAYRLDWPDGVTLFEVDHPALLSYKHKQLAPTGATQLCDTRTVPVDLAGNWAAELRKAGFRPGTRTVWFAEGLLFYLPQALAGEVMTTAATLSGPGSRLAADLIGTGIFRFRYMRKFLRRLEAAGSPWVFGTDDPGGFIESCGWHVLVENEPGHPTANYGRWPEQASPSTLPNLPRSYLISAALGG
jgi:methyltransferase (TIGR00027 family)